MAASPEIENTVERLVSETLERHAAQARQELVRRISDELQLTPGGANISPLPIVEAATASILRATTQTEILRALLDAAARFSGWVTVFVMRGTSAVGWQGRGFADENAIARITLDGNLGPATRAMAERTAVSVTVGEIHPGLAAALGQPADAQAVLLPLVVRDKVVALLVAEAAGTGQSALQMFARSAGLWLEVLSLRKASATAQPVNERGVGEGLIGPTEKVVESVGTLPSATLQPGLTQVAELAGQTPPSAEEQEVHNKARRFAKLLVDEIKLYNPAKVAEGRQNKDLYDRLKEDIEKSRETYAKRYGQTAAAGADYFRHELVRSLAENDTSLLGSNFPG